MLGFHSPFRQQQSVKAAHAARDGLDTIKIRPMRPSDVDRVADLTATCFGYGNFPGIDDEAIVKLEEWYATSIKRQAQEKLLEFISRKREAAALNRAYLLNQQVRTMKAALSQDRSLARVASSPSESKQVERWRRARTFTCLLAEDNEAVVASINLSMFQAQASLPAPFPSLAPWVLYISSLAVSPDQRRKGIGKRLLDQCEVIASRWGHGSIYLHCSGSNSGAIALYLSQGYHLVDPGPSFMPPQLRQMLMKKELTHRIRSPVQDLELQGLEDGLVRDGVFIWRGKGQGQG
jgi:ribosomal protein S18 acetylase RimI-like enzyme